MTQLTFPNVLGAQVPANRKALCKILKRICVICVICGCLSLRPVEAQSCGSSAECQRMAEEAAAKQDYDAFHTLAWRAVQTGPPNNPSLMYLLARAQSLSGRPQDALVMLRRLADMKFTGVDAETSEDFRRVRSLPEWPEVLERIYKAAGKTAPPAATPSVATTPAATPPESSSPATAPSPAPLPPTASVPSPAAPSTAAPSAAPSASPSSAKPPRSLAPSAKAPAAGFALPAAFSVPASMAYDAVSRRFVMSDERSDTLKIIDEGSLKTVNLVSPRWAAPNRPTALTIDPRRGDLWVTGAHDDANGVARSAVHRLQLVSGRLLYTVPLAAEAGAARFISVALAGSSVFVLDAHSRRIFEVTAASKSPRVHMAVEGTGDLTSLAATDGGELYVADAAGVIRLNAAARTSTTLAAPADLNLRGLQWIAYHDRSLLGIQRKDNGTLAAVRIRLNNSGSAATAVEVLGDATSRAAAIANGIFYYLSQDPGGSGIMMRRVPLR